MSYTPTANLSEQIQELKYKVSVWRSVSFVIIAVALVAIMTTYIMAKPDKAAGSVVDSKTTSQTRVHTVDSFNDSVIKAINEYRENKKLSNIAGVGTNDLDYVASETRVLEAAGEGCAYNRYADPLWKDVNCGTLVPYGPGFVVKTEVIEWTPGETPEAPTTADFIKKLNDKYNQSVVAPKKGGKKLAKPAILEPTTERAMVFMVGSAGEKWQVYMITVTKKA